MVSAGRISNTGSSPGRTVVSGNSDKVMIKKMPFIIIAIFSSFVGLYPFIYFFTEKKFGLLQSKSDDLLNAIFWNIGFYAHITLGGIALLIGWTQFIAKLRTNKVKLHRLTGKVYVVAALLSSTASIYIALNATGGMIPALGFIFLGIIWFYTTLKAYVNIKNMQIDEHQKMMIYSYAACLAAVTLRIYLPVLISLFHDFNKAYSLVAWLCWIPNIIVAYFLVKRLQKRKNKTAAKHEVNVAQP